MKQVKYASKEDLRFAYEQSISAYQKHVERYNTWMNMYAIMTGALFVAFYSNYGKDKMFLLLIAILGLLCSICWYGAVKGHYEWMKSFIEIVKFNEKKYFGKNGPFVYSKVIASEKSKAEGNFLYGFFSTQKITLFFIRWVALAWIGGIGLAFLKGLWVLIAIVVLLLIHSLVYLIYHVGCLRKMLYCKCLRKIFGSKCFLKIADFFKSKSYYSTILPDEIITKDIKL